MTIADQLRARAHQVQADLQRQKTSDRQAAAQRLEDLQAQLLAEVPAIVATIIAAFAARADQGEASYDHRTGYTEWGTPHRAQQQAIATRLRAEGFRVETYNGVDHHKGGVSDAPYDVDFGGIHIS
jgi:hypothetical protein